MVVVLHWVGNLCFSKFKRLPHNLIQHIPAFPDVKDAVHRYVTELLSQARNWPPDFDLADLGRFAYADVLPRRVAAKALQGPHGAVDRAVAPVLTEADADARSEGHFIGLDS